MQSGGSSIVATLLGQRSGALTIPDAWLTHPWERHHAMRPPVPEFPRLLVKTTVQYWDPFAYIDWFREVFSIEHTMLLLRNPYCTFVSLCQKKWGKRIPEKFSAMERLVLSGKYPVAFFEDALFSPMLFLERFAFWGLEPHHFMFPKTPSEMADEAAEQIAWCARNKDRWGLGNQHTSLPWAKGRASLKFESVYRPARPQDIERVDELAPELVKWYFDRRPEYRSLADPEPTMSGSATEGVCDPST